MAREIRTAGQDAIFAPTPPLESLRMILSMGTAKFEGGKGFQPCSDPQSENRTQLPMIDISRAYFNAKTDEEYLTYVECLNEIDASPVMCGLLRRHMYGTHRSAEGWQDESSSTLASRGLLQGSASACVFRHPAKNIALGMATTIPPPALRAVSIGSNPR